MSTFAKAQNNAVWSIQKKITFRFFFILLSFFIIFSNNGAFPLFYWVIDYPTRLMQVFIPWFSDNVLGYKYDHSIFTNGSGDTSYNYVQLAFSVFLSIGVAAIWSALDYKRKSYNQLYYCLLAVVRCYVAFTLLNYGSVKLIKLQFPDPSLIRLSQPYGDSSPMGLAWTFLGYSKGYNIFMGVIEVSAMLMLFRRTMVVGAFLALAASVHVMSMNYFYDVPVKILSTALVIMCLFVLAPYLKTISAFFLSGKAASLDVIEAPSYKKKWIYYSFYSFKYLVITWIIAMCFVGVMRREKQYGSAMPKPPLYGIYKTEKFKLNNHELAPLTTDTTRWAELIVSWKNYANVKLMNDSIKLVSFRVDSAKKVIVFNPDANNKYISDEQLNYSIPGRDLLRISGRIGKDSVNILLKKMDPKKFRLINRKFNWVNEYPYNK